MAIKKTELYSSLWASCNQLRGGMEVSQYKNYVLTFLFLKYISDKSTGSFHDPIKIPVGSHFDDIIELKNDKEIGRKLNKVIENLASSNDLLKNVIDLANFNDEEKLGKGKDMIVRLTNLIGIFQDLELGDNRAEHDDLLGDAYEYLLRHFANESGKSKGQFYTPSEVSRILVKVVGIDKNTPQYFTVYDGSCGSGSLLLKASDESKQGLLLFGQEIDHTTAALSKMNMILHGNKSAKITQGNTLSAPEYKNSDGTLKEFDFAIANPPFSLKNWHNGINILNDEFKRFEYGTPPDKNGDYAFLLHILTSLKNTGRGAVILPHGVLFRGHSEAHIRENLIKKGLIKGVIGLPANLFYGTTIPACIILLDKKDASSRRGIFIVDASKGFMKDGNKNRLRSQDIHKVVDVINNELELKGFSRMVSLSEIANNEYNLNISRFIDSSSVKDVHDLSAHISGGIPDSDIKSLDEYWQVFPTLKTKLFAKARSGYEKPLVKASEVNNTILAHAEFKFFYATNISLFRKWQISSQLSELAVGDNPKNIINYISELMLSQYADAKLLNKYNLYQLLMNYCKETLQDDLCIITQDGWFAGRVIHPLTVRKGKKTIGIPDLVIDKISYKSELIPPVLIIERYFSNTQNQINILKNLLESDTQALESYIKESTGEYNETLTYSGKVSRASILVRLKLATDTKEIYILKEAIKLIEQESLAKKAVRVAQEELDQKVLAKYKILDINEIKTLIVEDKWHASLYREISNEIERVTHNLAKRVQELEERYDEPLTQLAKDVNYLGNKVNKHLKDMGLSW
jgi:type I restriction enzyme M protein